MYLLINTHLVEANHNGDVMVSVLAWSTADRWWDPRSGLTKIYYLGICCFSAKHAALRRKSKNWLVRNQDNVSEWGARSILWQLLQWATTIKIQLNVLTLYKGEIISSNCYLFSLWYGWKKMHGLALSKNQLLTRIKAIY